MLLTFGPTSNRSDIPVTIIDNDVYELTESLGVILSYPGDPVPRVTLSPTSTVVTILDNDGCSPVPLHACNSITLSVQFCFIQS